MVNSSKFKDTLPLVSHFRFLQSTTVINIEKDGVILSLLQGGGGGSYEDVSSYNSKMSGSCGSYVCGAFPVKKGDVVTITIGSGGQYNSGRSSSGTSGGSSTLSINGSTKQTASGGGVFAGQQGTGSLFGPSPLFPVMYWASSSEHVDGSDYCYTKQNNSGFGAGGSLCTRGSGGRPGCAIVIY